MDTVVEIHRPLEQAVFPDFAQQFFQALLPRLIRIRKAVIYAVEIVRALLEAHKFGICRIKQPSVLYAFLFAHSCSLQILSLHRKPGLLPSRL